MRRETEQPSATALNSRKITDLKARIGNWAVSSMGTLSFFLVFLLKKERKKSGVCVCALTSSSAPMALENKKPTGGIEPPTFRLQSECSTTKLSRHASDISRAESLIYRNPPIAQLAERETVDG